MPIGMVQRVIMACIRAENDTSEKARLIGRAAS